VEIVRWFETRLLQAHSGRVGAGNRAATRLLRAFKWRKNSYIAYNILFDGLYLNQFCGAFTQ